MIPYFKPSLAEVLCTRERAHMHTRVRAHPPQAYGIRISLLLQYRTVRVKERCTWHVPVRLWTTEDYAESCTPTNRSPLLRRKLRAGL